MVDQNLQTGVDTISSIFLQLFKLMSDADLEALACFVSSCTTYFYESTTVRVRYRATQVM